MNNNLQKRKIIELELTPMMWGYMVNVDKYFQFSLYEKYGRVFGKIWIATAYKGASGELATMTSIQERYLNHLSWIDVMKNQKSKNLLNFTGVALTGWSRYDHFLPLCDLLPQAIPSLVFSLNTIQYGKLTEEKKNEITHKLGCVGQIPWFGRFSLQHLNCTFPGHEVYEAIMRFNYIMKNVIQTNLEFTSKYMTPLNLDYNYLHKQRAFEVTQKLEYSYEILINYKDKIIKVFDTMFYPETAVEWLYVYLVPDLDKVYNILKKTKELNSKNDWNPRPLPVTLKNYPKHISN
jgi:hexosaminidase